MEIMTKYYVATKELELLLTLKQKELMQQLPIDTGIKNKFPFDDLDRSKVELYKVGTYTECQTYIDEMDELIKGLFDVYECINDCELVVK